MFFNIKIILLYTKYSLKIKLKVNTVDPSITRSGFRPKGNMIHLKTSKKKKENTITERKIFLSGQKQFYKNLNFSRTCFNSVLYFPIWYGPSLNVFSMNTKSGLGILYVYEHVWVYKIQCIFIICVHKIYIPVHILCSHPWKQHRGCNYALWMPGSWIIKSIPMYQRQRKSRKYLSSEEERGRGGQVREARNEWAVFKGWSRDTRARSEEFLKEKI